MAELLDSSAEEMDPLDTAALDTPQAQEMLTPQEDLNNAATDPVVANNSFASDSLNPFTPPQEPDKPKNDKPVTPGGVSAKPDPQKLKTAPPLNFFSHSLMSSMEGMGQDRALAGINMTSQSTGRPIEMPTRTQAEQQYVKFLQSNKEKYDDDAKKQFAKYYRAAEREYRDLELGNFNSSNLKSTAINSVTNNQLGIFTNGQKNNMRGSLPRGIDLGGGMRYDDTRSYNQLVNDAIGGSGQMNSGEFVQNEAFEDIVRDKFNTDKFAAFYDNKTKDARRHDDGELVGTKWDKLGLGDALKMSVGEDGNVFPTIVQASDDAYGATNVLSDFDTGMSSNGAVQFFKHLSGGIAGNLTRVAGSAVNQYGRGDKYLANLGGGTITTEPFRTGYQQLDTLLENVGFVKPVGLEWNSQASFTDRLLGGGYESTDSKLAKQMLLASQRMIPGRSLDERGSALNSGKAFSAGLASVGAQLIPQLAAGLVTGGGSVVASVAYSGLDGYSAVYNDFRQQGYTNTEANVAGVIAGVVTAASTKLLEGNYMARLFKGQPKLMQAQLDDALLPFVKENVEQITKEAEAKGLKLTADELAGKMAERVPGMVQGFTKRIVSLGKRVGAFNNEGVQEVIEGTGQALQEMGAQNYVFNGKIYDALGLQAPDRLQVDKDAMQQRIKEQTWGNFIGEQLESFVLGQAGGAISELPLALSSKLRGARQEQEKRDLQRSLITYFVENNGKGMEALKERARTLGSENKWGTRLTKDLTVAQDGQQTENDYITESVLSQIELIERLGRESGVLQQYKQTGKLEHAVGSLAATINEADLFKRSLRNLLDVEIVRQDRDAALKAVQTPPAPAAGSILPGAATSAGQSLQNVAPSQLSPEQLKAERARRLAAVEAMQDSPEKEEAKKKLGNRYAQPADTTALGLITRYDDVADFYEAGREAQEYAYQLDRADAANVAYLVDLEKKREVALEKQLDARRRFETQLGTDTDLARVVGLAESQLKLDDAGYRARAAYDGTTLRHVTQESFLRDYYLRMVSLAKSPLFNDLSADDKQRVTDTVSALNDPDGGFFNPANAELAVDGDNMRKLNFDRKRRLATLASMEADRQAQQLQQVQVNDGDLLNATAEVAGFVAANDFEENTLGSALSRAQVLSADLSRGTLNLTAAEVQSYAQQLTALAAGRQAKLEADVAAVPENSFQQWYARQQQDPDWQMANGGLPADMFEDEHNDWLQEQKNLVNDALVGELNTAATNLTAQPLKPFATAPQRSTDDWQVLLYTTQNALTGVELNQGRNLLDEQIAAMEARAQNPDPAALASISIESLNEMRATVVRNTVLAELNQRVNNLFYDRTVLGGGVAVDADSLDREVERKKKLKMEEDAQLQAESDAATAVAAGVAPPPKGPETSAEKQQAQGEDLLDKTQETEAAQSVEGMETPRSRSQNMGELVRHLLSGGQGPTQNKQLGFDGEVKSAMQQARRAVVAVSQEISQQTEDTYNAWLAQPGNENQSDSAKTRYWNILEAQAAQDVTKRIQASAQAAGRLSPVGQLLGRVAALPLTWKRGPNGLTQAAGALLGAMGTATQAAPKLAPQVTQALEQSVQQAAQDLWHWNSPFGPTGDLYHQSETVYGRILQDSDKQLRRIDTLRRQHQQALSNRNATDLLRRGQYLAQHVDRLISLVVETKLFASGATTQLQLLADADKMLQGLAARKPQSLSELSAYQLDLHEAEQVLRKAFADPQHQRQLLEELLAEAEKTLPTVQGRTPERQIVQAWQLLHEEEGSPVAGTMATLAALFGADRASVAKQYEAFIVRSNPAYADGKKPTPSLEQEQTVLQAVQALTMPWLLADTHPISLVVEKQAATKQSVLSVAGSAVLPGFTMLTGFAGAGKTQMAAAPVVAVLAGLSGATSAGKAQVYAGAQYALQQMGIMDGLEVTKDTVETKVHSVDELISMLDKKQLTQAQQLVIDEATILNDRQAKDLAKAVLKENARRRKSGLPGLTVLLLGDPAQLVGEWTDTTTGVSTRMTSNHPFASGGVMIFPRVPPLKEIYRTGYIALSEVQQQLRERILSTDDQQRRNNVPLTVAFAQVDPASLSSLQGVQYMDVDAQRDQIKRHIEELERTQDTRTLKVIVSRADVDNEIKLLGAKGVTNPKQYVLSVDEVQGQTLDFAYVAVDERTSANVRMGNSNLRATLVGVSRARSYASVRTNQVAAIDNRQETKLPTFQDDSDVKRHPQRGAASDERLETTRALAALAAKPATPAVTPLAANTTQANASPNPAPAAAPITITVSTPQAQAAQTTQATQVAAVTAQVAAEDAAVDADDSDNPGSGTAAEAIATAADTAATATAASEEAEQARQAVSDEIRQEFDQLITVARPAAAALPAAVLAAEKAAVRESEELEIEDKLFVQDELTELRYENLTNVQVQHGQLVGLLLRASQNQDPVLQQQITEQLEYISGVIELETASLNQKRDSMLSVPQELDATKQADSRFVLPSQQTAEQARQEQAPVVEVVVSPGNGRPDAILVRRPVYNETTGAFLRMENVVGWKPDAGQTYIQQLNSAQAYLRSEIAKQRQASISYANNRVSLLADEGKILIHTFAIPKGNVNASLKNKSGILKRLFSRLKNTPVGATNRQDLTAKDFENYLLADGTELKGTGNFYLVWNETYQHGQELVDEQETKEFSSNIFELQYIEDTSAGRRTVNIGMVRREKKSSNGQIRKKGSGDIDDLLRQVKEAGMINLRQRLPLADVRPPVYLDKKGTTPRSIRAYREHMREQGVGVSSPFAITVSHRDDFAQGNYSFAYGELDVDGSPTSGGRKMLSGRGVVFTAFGMSQNEIDAEVRELIVRDLPASEIIETLRTRYDLEMELVTNRELRLDDYGSVLLGEAGAKLTSAAALSERLLTTTSASTRDGWEPRTTTKGVDQYGRPANPVVIDLITARSMTSAEQGRPSNGPAELANKPYDQRGLINKMLRLFADPELGLLKVSKNHKKVELRPKGKAFFVGQEHLIPHLETIVQALFADGAKATSRETNEKGVRKNLYYDKHYVGDLLLYLNYLDAQTDGKLTELWMNDSEENENVIQYNPSFGAGRRTNTFTQLGYPGIGDPRGDQAPLDIEEMLETSRETKTHPTFQLDVRTMLAQAAKEQAQQQGTELTDTNAPQSSPQQPPAQPLQLAPAPQPALPESTQTPTPAPAVTPALSPAEAPAVTEARKKLELAQKKVESVEALITKDRERAAAFQPLVLPFVSFVSPQDGDTILDVSFSPTSNFAMPFGFTADGKLGLNPEGNVQRFVGNGIKKTYGTFFNLPKTYDNVTGVQLVKPAVVQKNGDKWEVVSKGELAFQYKDGRTEFVDSVLGLPYALESAKSDLEIREKQLDRELDNASRPVVPAAVALPQSLPKLPTPVAMPAADVNDPLAARPMEIPADEPTGLTSTPAPGPGVPAISLNGFKLPTRGAVPMPSTNTEGEQNGDATEAQIKAILDPILGRNTTSFFERLLGRDNTYWKPEGYLSYREVYGAVVGGLMYLNRGDNGLFKGKTARHEALHYVLQLKTPIEQAQILGWARQAMANRGVADADLASELQVEEWLADHYADLFNAGDSEALARAKKWSWMPAPIMRFFFNVRDLFNRVKENDVEGQLQRALEDIEGGRYRGQRLELDANADPRHARNEMGLRYRRYEAVASIFGGREYLEQYADMLERKVYDLLLPSTGDGLTGGFKNDVEVIKSLTQYFWSAYKATDNSVHDEGVRGLAKQLFTTVGFYDGVGEQTVQRVSAIEAILQQRFKHLSGSLKFNGPNVEPVEDANSAIDSIYDADRDADDSLAASGEAVEDNQSEENKTEATQQGEESESFGKGFFLGDKERLPGESEELKQHIRMTPLLRKVGPGKYEATNDLLNVNLAYQVLRQAATYAFNLAAMRGTDQVSYQDFGKALQQIAGEQLRERHDVAASLLARFFDYDQSEAGQTNYGAARLLAGLPEGTGPSLLELSNPELTNRQELRGNPHQKKAAKAVKQLYSFYNSLQRRNLADVDLSGNVRLSQEVAEGDVQLKNLSNSSLINQVYKYDGTLNNWNLKPQLLENLTRSGFQFVTQDGKVTLARRHPLTKQLTPVINFFAPKLENNKDFAFHNGSVNQDLVQREPEFYTSAVFDLLSAIGFKGMMTEQQIRGLINQTNERGERVGERNFNQNIGRYLAQLYGNTVLAHLEANAESARGAGKKVLEEMGLTGEVREYFMQSAFRSQPKEDLNKTMNRSASEESLQRSPTFYWGSAIQPLTALLTASSLKPERLYAYNEKGKKVYLLQHGNAMYRRIRSLQAQQTRRNLVGEAAEGWFESKPDGYQNALVTGRFTMSAQDVLTAGVLEDKRTGRKRSIVSASIRELTRLSFEKLFLGELIDSQGKSVTILGSPKADKGTQTMHRLSQANSNYEMLLFEDSVGTDRALIELRASYDALARHQTLPRLRAAGLSIPETGSVKSQLAVAAEQLALRDVEELRGLHLYEGVDFDAAYDKEGLPTGKAQVSKRLSSLVNMGNGAFIDGVLASLETEAAELYQHGMTYFDGALIDQLVNKGKFKVLPDMSAWKGNGTAHKVRNADGQYHPLIKAFLISRLIHTHHLETGLLGSDLYFKNEVDYGKRMIALTTNYEAYDLNVWNGLPRFSNVAVLADETLGDILGLDETGENELATGRAVHSGVRYTHGGQAHQTVSTDNGQFFAVLRGMAPPEVDADEWARKLVLDQALADGQGYVTLLHDYQSLASGMQPETDESQRKLVNGGLGPDGSPVFFKDSKARITNELLALGNQHLWRQVINQLGGVDSPLYQKWQQIRAELREQLSPEQFEDQVTRRNRDWKRLAYEVAKDRSLEQYHIGATVAESGAKKGASSINQQLATRYNAVRMDNTQGGVVLGLGQNLKEADIANITQENYIFSLQAMNWETTEAIQQNLAKLAAKGLVDMQVLVDSLGGQEVFMRRAEEMADNMGNISNTNSMMRARLNPNVPLLRSVLGGAIASQIKSSTTKLRFKGARLTVQTASGRVNMYEVNGQRLNQRQLVRDGYATINEVGEVVPTELGKDLKVSELAFTRFAGADGKLLPAAKMEELSRLLSQPLSSDPQERMQQEAANAAAMEGITILPMEVMAPRGLMKEFDIPASMDVDQVTLDYFTQVETSKLRLAYDDAMLRGALAGAAFAESGLDPATTDEAVWTAQQAALYSAEDIDAVRENQVEQNQDYIQQKAQERWDNWQQIILLKVTRIPVTGMNSIQIAKVVGFYDSQANTLLMPSQVQVVSGQDNDGDMATVELFEVGAGGYTIQGEKALTAQIRNNLRAEKMKALMNPINMVQMFHPIDFSGLSTYKKKAIALEGRLKQAASNGQSYGPMGRMFRFVPSMETLVKNQQGKSGVGPFVKLAQLYYQNAAMLKFLEESDRFVGQKLSPEQSKLKAGYEKALRRYEKELAKYERDLVAYEETQKLKAALEKIAGQGKVGEAILITEPKRGKKGSAAPVVEPTPPVAPEAPDLTITGGYVLGDLPKPIRYGQYTRSSVLYDEVGTSKLLENVANGSLDNVKNDLLGWLNVNPQMWGAYSGMMVAQIPEAEIFALLSHPYVKQIAEQSQRSQDVDQRYSRSVIDITRAILTGETERIDTDEDGELSLVPAGGMGYESSAKNFRELQRQIDEQKAAARMAVYTAGGTEQEQQAAADAIEDADVQAVQSLKQQVLERQATVEQVPALADITELRPKSDHVDFETKRFAVEQLFLFSLRGDELLKAQGVMRAMEGPPSGDADALRVLTRVLDGLNYKPSEHGGIDGAIEVMQAELLDTETLEGQEPQPSAAALKAVTKHSYELVNARAHVAFNPYLRQAIEALIFDYRQRQQLFISRQPVVQDLFNQMQRENRRYYGSAGNGMPTLIREFGRWVDSRWLSSPAGQLHVPTDLRSDSYLDDLANADLGTLDGQLQFMRRATDYIVNLRTKYATIGYRGPGNTSLLQQLQPRDNEFGSFLTVIDAENLRPEQKAVLESQFASLSDIYGLEGEVLQQVLFRYALVSKGLLLGKNSLAEIIAPRAVSSYSAYLGDTQRVLGDNERRGVIEEELKNFRREFALLNPESAPELVKGRREVDGESRKASYYYDRELPSSISELIFRGDNYGMRNRPVEELPKVMRIPNQYAPGQNAVYELTLTSGENGAPSFRYERRYSAASPQINGYGVDAFSSQPVLEVDQSEIGQPVLELLKQKDSLIGKRYDQLQAEFKADGRLKKGAGVPILLSTGETLMVREGLRCGS